MRRLRWAAAGLGAAVLGLCLTGPARGQGGLELPPVSGSVALGVRGLSGEDQAASFETYRELEPGPTLRADVLSDDRESGFYLRGWAEQLGERDEAHRLELGRWQRGRAWLAFDDLPHVFSNQARSLYGVPRSEVYTLPPGLQASLEGQPAATQAALLSAALAGATGRALELRLRSGRAGARYTLDSGLALQLGYDVVDRSGTRPGALGFSTPGGNFANAALPVDDATHRARATLSVPRPGLNLELTYSGSLYRNELDALVVANPLRATDDPANGAARGRLSVAPDNDAHSLAVAGAWTLPTAFPASASFALSYALWRQDESFLPHTINSTLADPGLALPRGDLDGEVGVLSLNLRATARPRPGWTARARYRLYDHDSRTRALTFPAEVQSDRTLDTTPRTATPLEFRRQNLDLRLVRRRGRARFEAGYAWEHWNRSDARTVRSLGEHTGTLGLGLRTRAFSQLRAEYAWSVRRGGSYRPFAHLSEALQPADRATAAEIGPFPGLRQADVADRVRNRLKLSAHAAPSERLRLRLHGSLDDQRFDDTDFGLVGQRSWAVGWDADYALSERVGLAAFYTYEDIRYDLEARFRPRRFIPPFGVVDAAVNNWDSRSTDRVHNGGVSLHLDLIPKRLRAELRYSVQTADAETRGNSRTGVATAAPPTTSGDGGNAVSYPDLDDVLQVFAARLDYAVREDWRLKLEYRYERFDLDSFSTESLAPFLSGSNVNNSGVVSPSTDIFLANRTGEFDAHILALSLTYRF